MHIVYLLRTAQILRELCDINYLIWVKKINMFIKNTSGPNLIHFLGAYLGA
jgi:hypothetical protein